MKRFIVTIIFLSVLGFVPTVFVFAQNTNQDLEAVILQLKEQIKILQQEIENIKLELTGIKAEIKFTKTLRQGVSGDEVRELQEFLKQFPDIYPEGLVTGYFGPLTEAAIQRLQEKQGIVSEGTALTTGYGQVGPKTRAQLNSLLANGADSSKVTSPGLTMTPGIQSSIATSTATTTVISVATTTPSGTIPATPAVPATPPSGGGGGGGGSSATPATPVTPTPTPTPEPEEQQPEYLLDPFDSSLKINTDMNIGYSVEGDDVKVFSFTLSDNAQSPYEGTSFTHAENEEIQIRKLRLVKKGSINNNSISSIKLIDSNTGYVLQSIDSITDGAVVFDLEIDSSKPDWGVMVSWKSYSVVVSISDNTSGTISFSIEDENDVAAYDYRNDSRKATITSLNSFPLDGPIIKFRMPIPIIVDYFDSYEDGSVLGQGGWESYKNGSNFMIQDSTTFEGAKALYNNSTEDSVVGKMGTALSDGSQAFYVRTENRDSWGEYNDGNAQVRVSKNLWASGAPGLSFAAVSFKESGNVAFYNVENGVYQNFAVYADNEWTLLEIEWRSSDTSARYRVNYGAWTDWYIFANSGSFTDFDYVGFDFLSPGGSGGAYFDAIF